MHMLTCLLPARDQGSMISCRTNFGLQRTRLLLPLPIEGEPWVTTKLVPLQMLVFI